MSCYRLVGKEGEICQTCGRRIVKTHEWANGDYALQHEGQTISARLHDLERKRRADDDFKVDTKVTLP